MDAKTFHYSLLKLKYSPSCIKSTKRTKINMHSETRATEITKQDIQPKNLQID